MTDEPGLRAAISENLTCHQLTISPNICQPKTTNSCHWIPLEAQPYHRFVFKVASIRSSSKAATDAFSVKPELGADYATPL